MALHALGKRLPNDTPNDLFPAVTHDLLSSRETDVDITTGSPSSIVFSFHALKCVSMQTHSLISLVTHSSCLGGYVTKE